MGRFIDRTGLVVGRLTFLERGHTQKCKNGTRVYWKVLCECGTIKEMLANHIITRRVVSCGCYQENRKTIRPYESLYNRFLRTNKDKNIELTYEEFLEYVTISSCYYCESKITWAIDRVTQNGVAYNLDRTNNDLGYTKENCVVCCRRCNVAKSNHFTHDQWKAIAEFMKTRPIFFGLNKEKNGDSSTDSTKQ